MSNLSSLSPFPEDDFWMGRALDLARRGTALAHPNPLVGTVIIRNEQVVGEGFHTWEGVQHAEVVALEKAGHAARSATLYCNLEPCCHTGRTCPCTKAILSAGIRRVVVGMRDPNPRVAGRGLRELQRAGLEVVEGVREREARALNEDFACWIRLHRSFVTLKTAATLDGQIASRSGSATWITSKTSREDIQGLRHASDALLTGIGTVLADDPRLTDRSGQPRRRQLLRAVLDSHLRIPLKSRLVRESAGDLIVFTTRPLDSLKARALRRTGAEVFHARGKGAHMELRNVIEELRRREHLSILIEAGAKLNAAALRAGIVDKLVVYFAPKVLGGGNIPMFAHRWQSARLAPGLRFSRLRFSGPDVVLEGYFHDVYGHHPGHRKN